MAIIVPSTTTVTSHGLVIQAAGQVVGAINSWNPQQGRTVTPVFELGSVETGGGDDIQADSGEPFEVVPGNITGTTLSITRYDIYTRRFETAFGTNNLEMLTRQTSSIRFIEFWNTPQGQTNYNYVYYGAWFNSLGRQLGADGNRISMASATATYTRRRELGA